MGLNAYEKNALLEMYSQLAENRTKEITLLDGVTANGAGTAVNVLGYSQFQAQVAGITTATVKVEGSVDGTNYADISSNGKTSNAIFNLISGLYKNIRGSVTNYAGSSPITLKVIARK
ncbi:MAG: hypothetical protein KBG36_00235 [Candidatus Marinimicrobia bacterium]|nr:hypothetical protein [Candidatus Neomarinimicrobiota bacterium]